LRDDAGLMTRRATVCARAEVTRIVNERPGAWHRRAARDALLARSVVICARSQTKKKRPKALFSGHCLLASPRRTST
jgi:hypothetical protein